MTRKPTSSFGITVEGVVSVVTVLLTIVILAAVVRYGEGSKSATSEIATPPYPWVVLHGGDGGTEEFNSWKIRVFYFVEQSYLVNPAFTDSLFKTLGLTYQMSDSTFIGTAPVIQQNTPVPNVQ